MSNNPYGNLGGMDLGSAIQNTSGISSDFTNAAQAMGFMPNPYASPGQQYMDATRFLALMKNINDTTMGTNNSWNRLSPGNPVNAMPLYMKNMFNAYGALVNSPQGMNLLPNGSQGMFQNGGYQAGPLGSNMSRMLQAYLGQMNPSQQPTPSDVSRAEQGTNAGPGTIGAQTPGGSAAPASGQGTRDNNSPNYPGAGPTIPLLSGVNDFARNIPVAGAALSGAENAIGDLTGRSDTQGGGNVGGGVPVLSGLNDLARIIPTVGGLEDITGGLMNAATGRNPNISQTQGGGTGGTSAVTVNPSGGPAPRSLGLLLQRMGMNSVPQGIDPNAFVDNALYKILGGQ